MNSAGPPSVVRIALLKGAYYLLSVLYILLASIAMLLPGRKAVSMIVRRYALRMVQAMHYLGGVRLETRGRERLPAAPVIIAAKHHSWFDGFCMFHQFDDLAFVTGSHLEKFPLLSGVLKKVGAIVVDNCGGHKARAALANRAAEAAKESRSILIYPEGHLSAVGEYHRYRTGVFHMYKNFGMPVVPVATNLGVFIFSPHDKSFLKRKGTAVVEFLDPIPPGLDRTDFMRRLQEVVEARSNELIAEATGEPVKPSVQTVEE